MHIIASKKCYFDGLLDDAATIGRMCGWATATERLAMGRARQGLGRGLLAEVIRRPVLVLTAVSTRLEVVHFPRGKP
jgi:hypothetical protein